MWAGRLPYLAVLVMVSLLVVWTWNTVASRKPVIQTPMVGDNARSMTFEHRERTYLLHLPVGYDGSRSLPLVIVLHGGAGNARNAANMTGGIRRCLHRSDRQVE